MTIDEQINFLTRGCVDVVSKADLAKKLESGKTLTIKLGCDPTSADLHLGHSVVLSLLRRFQDLGHKAILVIGDFTWGTRPAAIPPAPSFPVRKF